MVDIDAASAIAPLADPAADASARRRRARGEAAFVGLFYAFCIAAALQEYFAIGATMDSLRAAVAVASASLASDSTGEDRSRLAESSLVASLANAPVRDVKVQLKDLGYGVWVLQAEARPQRSALHYLAVVPPISTHAVHPAPETRMRAAAE